jgi:hypothetical protein
MRLKIALAVFGICVGSIFIGILMQKIVDLRQYQTRTCDIQCNKAQCACVRTCPTERGQP